MLRFTLLAGAMMFAAPAVAQDAQTTPQTSPSNPLAGSMPAPTAPQQSDAGDTTPEGAPVTSPPGTPAPAPEPAPTPAPSPTPTPSDSPPPDTAAAQPSGDAVAQAVNTQFATYDKDSDGALSKAEFAAWMTALKASTPAAAAETPAQKTAWNDAAFKQADGDKSATVSKVELASFLSAASGAAS